MGRVRLLRRSFPLVLGLKLYVITTPDGMPVAWCLASPAIGEREVAAGLLAHAARTGALRPGLTLIGDKGFAGREFEDLLTTGYGLRLVRPDRRDEPPRHGSIGWIRQWIESASDTFKGQLDLERHGGRTTAGVHARIAQRLLAPGRRHLAQLGHRRTGQTVADRL
jgi:hypothetical protein